MSGQLARFEDWRGSALLDQMDEWMQLEDGIGILRSGSSESSHQDEARKEGRMKMDFIAIALIQSDPESILQERVELRVELEENSAAEAVPLMEIRFGARHTKDPRHERTEKERTRISLLKITLRIKRI